MNALNSKAQYKRAQTIKMTSTLVVIDCSKAEHVIQFLHPAQGLPLLKRALNVKNSAPGVEKLLEVLRKTCTKNKLVYEQSIFVMEDPASYSRNFISQLQKKGFEVNYVNAYKASVYRLNTRASSDELDLDGIGGAAMRGHMINMQKDSEIYKRLTASSHERARLIKEQSSHENIMHTYIDELFPNFFNHKQSGVESFSENSLKLMLRSDFSICNYGKKSLKRLTITLHKIGFSKPDQVATKLLKLAKNGIKPPLDYLDDLKERLQQGVKLFQQRRKSIETEENCMAKLLALTPGFYLTSIPGISIILASYIMAELGNPLFWGSADQISSYAGIIPRQKQSGGSAKAPVVMTLPKDCNKRLKSTFFSVVNGTQKYDHPSISINAYNHDLKKHYHKVENRGGKSRTSTAKKFVRIMRAMLKKEDIYMPRTETMPAHQLAAWITIETQNMFKKWAAYEVYPHKNNILGEWQEKKDKILTLLRST